MEAVLNSRGGPWVRLFDTNVLAAAAAFTSGGLAARPLSTPFAASGGFTIIDLGSIPTAERPDFVGGEDQPNSIQLRFFGDDANNKSFSARIWGLTKGKGSVQGTPTQSWEDTILAQLLITLGNINGVANTLIEAASFEADTISLTYGASQDIVINSNAADIKQAWARIDHLAFPMIGVELDESVNAGTAATGMNALYRFLW